MKSAPTDTESCDTYSLPGLTPLFLWLFAAVVIAAWAIVELLANLPDLPVATLTVAFGAMTAAVLMIIKRMSRLTAIQKRTLRED